MDQNRSILLNTAEAKTRKEEREPPCWIRIDFYPPANHTPLSRDKENTNNQICPWAGLAGPSQAYLAPPPFCLHHRPGPHHGFYPLPLAPILTSPSPDPDLNPAPPGPKPNPSHPNPNPLPYLALTLTPPPLALNITSPTLS